MANISLSEYGKFVSLQNNSGSANAEAPAGGLYLFASGAVGSARLYMQNEGGTITDLAKSLDIDAFDALGGTGLHQTQDHFVFSDNGTEKKITFSNLQDAVFADVSGDATIAAGGALTIAAQAVENSMLADDAVGADELAANAVVNASIASNAAIDMDKLDGGSLASSLSDLAQGDLMYAGDVDDSNNLKSITFSNLEDAIFGNVSGDATIAAGGALTIAADSVENSMLANITRGSVKVGGTSDAPTDLDAKTSGQILVGDGTDIASVAVSGDVTLAANGAVTIANDAVESGMLNDNVISGQTELAHADIADADELMVSDGGTLKKVGIDSLQNHYFAAVSGDATIADGGALTIAANAVQTGMVHDDVATELAGAGLAASSGVMSVGVSGSVVVVSDKVGLSGSVAGTGLTFTGGKDSIATLALDIDELSALGGAGLHQTQDHFVFSDNGTEKKITFSNLQDAVFADVSGDATVAAGGALTVAAGAIEHGMLAEDIISGQAALGGASVAQADLLMLDDGPGAVKKVTFSNFEDSIFGNVSGDLAVAAGGAATIQADAVEGSMLNDNVISGQTELAHADIASADELMISDGGTLKKVGLDSLRDHYFGQVSGDATIADGGALTIAAQAVENSMLADDAVGADELAANAVVNASVASNAAIEGTKLNLNVDFGGNFAIGNQSDDVCQFGGILKVGGNSILDSGNNGAITFDGSGNTQAAGALTVGTDGGGKQFTVHGASANEFMRYIPGDNLLKFQNGSSATILTLGGDATSEYAVDVTNGANNSNKIRAAAFVTYSDESLKQDVATMNTALDTVMSLNGVEFTWKDSGERDFGFIAQDVQSVLPKAVHTADDGVQGVDYSRLTSVLVEAVKAQQVQIQELKALLKK